jgi:hypothetical protein
MWGMGCVRGDPRSMFGLRRLVCRPCCKRRAAAQALPQLLGAPCHCSNTVLAVLFTSRLPDTTSMMVPQAGAGLAGCQ